MNFLSACRSIAILFPAFVAFILNQYPVPGNCQSVPVNLTLPGDTIIIHQIRITGNKVTRKSIILRELDFRENDTLTPYRVSEALLSSRQNVFNTHLFNFVTIDTSLVAGTHLADVNIAVVERWYLWPIPYIEISDRNFNVWWETRDFNRLTYGIDFTLFNARGRNETLKILTHFGFNQRFGFEYSMPYLNKKQTIGTGFGAGIDLNRELPVFTRHNQPVYMRSDSNYLKKMLYGFARFVVRPDIFSTHSFKLAYSYYVLDSNIRSIPGYVLLQQDIQQFLTLNYVFKIDHRDVQSYPLKGYFMDVELNHSIPYATAHNSYLATNFRAYLQLYNRWYWASGFTGKLSFEKTQPYYLQRGFGYGRDYVRGYEYYVIDGQHFALLKNNLKFALIPQCVEKIGFLKSEKFNTIPLALYLNAFADMGYAYHYPGESSANAGNTLENSFLLGYGLGVDFTTYYDIVIRIEGSMNLLNRPGIYLHFIAPI